MNELSHEAPTAADPIRPARQEPRASMRGELVRSPYPRMVGRAIGIVARHHVRKWDAALARVRETQEKTLAALLGYAKDTEFGRAHRFARIRGYEDFAREVSLGDYDSFAPFIDRMRSGESNLLVPGFVRHFGNSSGSSNHGKSKFLPITERQIRFQQQAGADTVMRYLDASGDDQLFCGFTLGLFPPTTMREEGPVLVTSNPALMMTRMPIATRPVYLPEDDVRTIANYDEKLDVIAARYIDHDVRAVAGTTCWFTLLFEKVLVAARARGRSARSVSEIWPNLRVLLGGGVSATPYLPVIRDLMGRGDVTLVDTYNATEGGVYAASDFSGESGLRMLPHRGTFFEFVPIERRGEANPSRIPLWAVSTDQPYSIVVTTASGLYAYEIGDIVRFTSVDPLRIEFMGRLSGCLSVTQELTTHVEIERAVAHAIASSRSAADRPVTTVDFGAAADVGVDGSAKSRYVLFVEFQEDAAPADMRIFCQALDEGLCRENRVYREHRRDSVAILPATVVPLVRGGARSFLEEITGGNVQGKFPRIIDDTKKKLLWKHAAVVR